MIQLQAKQIVTAIRLAWAEPYAESYRVQYWLGKGDPMDGSDTGEWRDFTAGIVSNGKGGTADTSALSHSGRYSIRARADDRVFQYVRLAWER